MFGQKRKMFGERQVMERHLLGGKGALILRVKIAFQYSIACVARGYSTEAASPEYQEKSKTLRFF